MAKFVFKLDPLLRLRRREEEERQRDVAKLEIERRTLEDRIRDCQNQITSCKHDLRGKAQGPIDMNAMRLYAATARGLEREANDAVLTLVGVHKRLDAARERLRDAARQRRAIEHLRERRLEAFKRRLDKAETALLDELNTIAGARRRREASATETYGS